MNSYEKICKLLAETRSSESRAKTKGRKVFGKKVSSTKAQTIGRGKSAAHGIARAKLYHHTSKELKAQAKKSAVTKRPTHKSSGILRRAAGVLRKSGKKYEKGAQQDIIKGTRLAATKHYKN